jgi:2',3'-cyclic-nucleotide 2'-phosphodiesterase (5'-nucleotidase family)
MFPFDNVLQTFDITGSELLETLRIIQSGQKGFYHSWNLQMKVTYSNL